LINGIGKNGFSQFCFAGAAGFWMVLDQQDTPMMIRNSGTNDFLCASTRSSESPGLGLQPAIQSFSCFIPATHTEPPARGEPTYNPRMSAIRILTLALALPLLASAQRSVSFATDDGGHICADLYGEGSRAVVLAHGGRFNKESWRDQALSLTAAGFQILAIDFRGIGCSTGPGQADFDTAPFDKDVLAAVHYLKTNGARTVSIVGGSFGGAAAGDASIKSAPGEIDRIVFLGAAPNLPADGLKSRALFIVARDDRSGSGLRLPGIQAQYKRAPQPKQLIVLEGSAHAQYLFQTDQKARVMREILRFLSAP